MARFDKEAYEIQCLQVALMAKRVTHWEVIAMTDPGRAAPRRYAARSDLREALAVIEAMEANAAQEEWEASP